MVGVCKECDSKGDRGEGKWDSREQETVGKSSIEKNFGLKEVTPGVLRKSAEAAERIGDSDLGSAKECVRV